MDVTSLRYMTSIHSEELEAQKRLSETQSTGITQSTETGALESNAGSVESSFATALREEIAQLRGEESEQGVDELEMSFLSDSTSMLFGTTDTSSLLDTTDTLNLGSLSEMMGSASGRQAINAMADAALNSLVFTGESDNDQMTILESLLQDDQSVQQEIADTLEQILNRLEEGHVISE